MFRSHFRMHQKCSQCGYHFDRGAGYWLGAIYVNYGITAIVTAAYLILFFTRVTARCLCSGLFGRVYLDLSAVVLSVRAQFVAGVRSVFRSGADGRIEAELSAAR